MTETHTVHGRYDTRIILDVQYGTGLASSAMILYSTVFVLSYIIQYVQLSTYVLSYCTVLVYEPSYDTGIIATVRTVHAVSYNPGTRGVLYAVR